MADLVKSFGPVGGEVFGGGYLTWMRSAATNYTQQCSAWTPSPSLVCALRDLAMFETWRRKGYSRLSDKDCIRHTRRRRIRSHGISRLKGNILRKQPLEDSKSMDVGQRRWWFMILEEAHCTPQQAAAAHLFAHAVTLQPPMASACDRLRYLKAFDDTKAGVKGLIDAGITTVPAIFRHPPDTLARAHDEDRFAIPVIDLAGVTTAPSRRAELVAEVKAAAETVGFFQVVNHGVPGPVMSEMLAALRSFNEEPAEARRPYYSRDGQSRVRYHSNFDLFRSPAANWRDTLYLDMAPTGPSPGEIPAACRGIAVEFTREVQRLGGTLFELLSEAMGLHRGFLEQHEAGCLEGLSVVGHYYPASPQPHLTMGTSRHTDPSFLTVLLQDIGGLQVLHRQRNDEQPVWVEVPAEAGAFTVNVGDFLQLLSNDRFRSVEHRVLSKSVGPRVSVACFFRPHGAAAAARVCAPILVGDGAASPPRYRSVTVEELIVHYRDKALDGTSMLDHYRI
ncbi:unnamed protein product [Triticum turgidum subsp. durum]|uniref:Fe2OG dioxygenase domain-containing protein n=3 Tax=Triticum TaxID=4564 RepID=A0A9R0XXD3_TRITD|nr:unnamed protein product [Triticum turgidum subsp. durum]